ncbi:MAG: PAS domain-containing protein [Rhodospirillaceae bacterium]|nr:PAS domain-containing protein [Rhodospirillaceae bacterium]
MTDTILETIRALVLLGIVFFLWNAGRNRFEQSRRGWNLIITGFGLLLFGSILDISDNFENLNSFIIIGDTETEAFLEKFVGFLGGFVFLAIGLFKWIPGVQALSDLVNQRTLELQETNTSLEKNRESLEVLADNLPVFISLKDTEGRFQFVNKCFKDWVCVSNDDIIGKTVYDIYPEEQAIEFSAKDREAIDNNFVLSQEVELSYPDGKTRSVISTRFPVSSSTDTVIGLGTINFDITKHKVAERLKNEFISTVSHELRTPLTSIKGSLGLIKSGTVGELPAEFLSMLNIAYDNSDRLVLLINDILDMEKIEAGKMLFQMKPTDISSLLEEAIEANKGFGDEHGISFVHLGTANQFLVDADKDRLMQVLSNLMSNAAKFSPPGGRVELAAVRDNGIIRIAVKDNGPGIPEEFRDTIFEKFSQADSSDTRQKGGTGLGLSITKAIVEEHGGTIDFHSEAGVGCTFFFTLPILQ